jgi:hypothetical protein
MKIISILLLVASTGMAEVLYEHTPGKDGWHRSGMRWEHDGTTNGLLYAGLRLEFDKPDAAPADVTLKVVIPPARDKQDYVPESKAVLRVSGAGKQRVFVPWSAFDFPQATPAFLKFIQRIELTGNVSNAKVSFTRGDVIALETPVKSRCLPAAGRVTYPVTVFNCSEEKQSVVLSLAPYGWENMKTSVSPTTLDLAPGTSAIATVTVDIPERVAPGGKERQTLRAIANGNEAVRLEFITARDVAHPYLLHTAERWAEVREKVKKYDWARAGADEYIAKAEKWKVPEVAKFDKPPDDGMGPWLFDTKVELDLKATAIAWQLTGKKAYAKKVATFLRRLAEGYPRTLRGCNQDRVHEGHFFKHIAQSYDMILDADILTPQDKAQIEVAFRLMEETMDFEANTGNVSNWVLSEMSGALFTALMNGDLERAERFYRGPGGVLDQLGKGVMDDGWWFECAISYNSWMAQLGTEIGLALEPWGENLKTMKIPNSFALNFGIMPWQTQPGLYGMSFEKWGPVRRNYVLLTDLWDGFLPFVDYRGVMFGANDSDEKMLSGNLYELAYYVYRDPKYAAMIKYGEKRDVLWAVPELPAKTPELYRQSAYADNAGVIVLRSQTPGRPQREQIQAALKYGSHGGFHGHFDRASLLSVMRYGRSFYHPEMVWPGYASYLYKFYVQTSLTKNMVVVDDKMQEPVESKRLLFHSGPMLQAAAVETNARWSYPPYGGMVYEYIPEAKTFADKLRLEGKTFPIAANPPKYGEVTGFTEPVLQRRLLVVTDDYIVESDYLKAGKPHTFDLLHQIKGFRGIEVAESKLLRHTPTMDNDPLNCTPLVTDCDWYSVTGPAVVKFEMDFTGKKDKDSGFNDRNDPGPLFMDVHCVWPESPRKIMLGNVPENRKILPEEWRRKTMVVRTTGTEVRFLTVLEVYEDKPMVKSARATGPDHIVVSLADGREQRLTIRDQKITLEELRNGNVIRTETAR